MSVNQVDKQTGDTSRIAGGTLYADAPIGAILAFGGATAPAGWLLCQGQAISRTTYAALFAAIGTAFGAGDGSTTFNIPDLREATTKGAGETGQTVGAHVKSGGLAVGEFIDDRLQEHQHKTRWPSGTSPDSEYIFTATSQTSTYMSSVVTDVYGGRSGDTTEVKAVGVNYIIKAEQVALPADFATELDKKQNITDNTLETDSKTVPGAINEIKSDLGDKSNLNTTTKKDLVAAINEVNLKSPKYFYVIAQRPSGNTMTLNNSNFVTGKKYFIIYNTSAGSGAQCCVDVICSTSGQVTFGSIIGNFSSLPPEQCFACFEHS